ncbi:MAG: hypothetical protein ACRBFS_04000 [Aureispira sp.]
MTPEQEKKIKKIKANINTLEKALPKILDDKDKRATWVSDIAALKSSIDLIERQKTKSVNSNGKTTKETTLDFGAFKKDVEEHYNKLYVILNKLLPLFPTDWEKLLASTCYSPISSSDLNKIKTLLVKAKTEIQPLYSALNFYSNNFDTKENNPSKAKYTNRVYNFIEGTKKDVKEQETMLEKMQTYTDNYFSEIEEPKPDVNKPMSIKIGKYGWSTTVNGTISWNGKQQSTITSEKNSFEIPWSTKGSIELTVKVLFTYKGAETASNMTYISEYDFEVNDSGVLKIISQNIKKNNKDTKDIIQAISNTIFSSAKDGGTLAKNQEKNLLTAINENVKNMLSACVITTNISDDKTQIITEVKAEVTSEKFSLAVNAGATIPHGAEVGATGGYEIEMPAQKGNNRFSITLKASKEQSQVERNIKIQFNSRKDFKLDKGDMSSIRTWWNTTRIVLKREAELKFSQKTTSKKELQKMVNDYYKGIMQNPKAYTIHVTGFSSKGISGKTSRSRTASIINYLKKELEIKEESITKESIHHSETCQNDDQELLDDKECQTGTLTFSVH